MKWGPVVWVMVLVEPGVLVAWVQGVVWAMEVGPVVWEP
jgi:hypothetical protein